MDFTKSIVILVKVDEIYNILKSTRHYLLVETLDGIGRSKLFCWSLFIRLLRPSFDKGHTSSCKRYDGRERGLYYNIDDKLIQKFKKIEIDENSNF